MCFKNDLIKFINEKTDRCFSDDFPICEIETWIREFFYTYQPERSKREDSQECEMRCSEHCGNTVREVQ